MSRLSIKLSAFPPSSPVRPFMSDGLGSFTTRGAASFCFGPSIKRERFFFSSSPSGQSSLPLAVFSLPSLSHRSSLLLVALQYSFLPSESFS